MTEAENVYELLIDQFINDIEIGIGDLESCLENPDLKEVEFFKGTLAGHERLLIDLKGLKSEKATIS